MDKQKIKKLAEQAGAIENENMFGAIRQELCGNNIEKFAELIIKECGKVADAADEWSAGVSSVDLLKHFGVKDE